MNTFEWDTYMILDFNKGIRLYEEVYGAYDKQLKIILKKEHCFINEKIQLKKFIANDRTLKGFTIAEVYGIDYDICKAIVKVLLEYEDED